MKIKFLIALTILLFSQCAPTRYVKPLKKNEQAASFTFGGPIIKYSGAAIPIPYMSVGYAYGISNKITGYSNLHVTSLLFDNLQLDAGATYLIFEKEKKYGLSVSSALQIGTSLKAKNSFRIWPSSDVNFYYHVKEKPSYLFAGLNAWYELSAKKAHQEIQNTHVLPSIHGGYVLIKNNWSHQFQLSYLGLGIANLPNVVSFVGIANKGSLGFHYGLIRTF